MPLAVEIESLQKVYRVRERAESTWGSLRQLLVPREREVVAVNGVSFRIERGERVAFIGENGAGKSTTLKMLCGILRPDGGSARVAGFVPWREREQLSHRIGTVFGQRSQLWYHLPVVDSFELLRAVYDQPGAVHHGRRARLIEAFDVGRHLDKPVRQLSLGERMRCEIVASLLHGPELLFLDEPTIGLDVAAKATIREVLRDDARASGRTLLLTSHDTADMEQVCERVIVIHAGRILLDQPLATLRRDYIQRKRVVLQLEHGALTGPLPPGVRIARALPHRVELEVDLAQTPVERVLTALLASVRVRDLTIEDPPLDEIVQAIYERARAGAEALEVAS